MNKVILRCWCHLLLLWCWMIRSSSLTIPLATWTEFLHSRKKPLNTLYIDCLDLGQILMAFGNCIFCIIKINKQSKLYWFDLMTEKDMSNKVVFNQEGSVLKEWEQMHRPPESVNQIFLFLLLIHRVYTNHSKSLIRTIFDFEYWID